MKAINTVIRSVLSLILAAALMLPFLPRVVTAQNQDKAIIHIGSPQVWSLGQAHYLLAKMHKDDRALATKMPGSEDLDPNGINATRIQMIQRLLDIEAQFSQKTGVENNAALREEQVKLKQRSDAQAALSEKQKELQALDKQILDEQQRLAALQVADKARDEARNATTPVTPPTPDDLARKQEIAQLTVTIQHDQDSKTKLTQDITTLQTTANSSVTPSGLAEPPLNASAGTLPGASDFIKDRLKSVANNMGQPRLAASIVLDNFIAMQGEIIAKQLTLLRDEAGPYKRVIFLELPSSIYTAACKSDDYVVQVQWKVTHYNNARMDEETGARLERTSPRNQKPVTTVPNEVLQQPYDPPRDEFLKIKEASDKIIREGRKKLAIDRGKVTDIQQGKSEDFADSPFKEDRDWHPVSNDEVRAIDIIPRQSALNVNDVQSTVSRTNFLGVMKLLLGLGIKVNYQRQKELYEQYLQQEVFASGFGKGLNAFGWTFGPLPGTKRVAPGTRTTYAILAIPDDTTLLGIEAKAVTYHRKTTPKYDVYDRDYTDDKQVIAQEQFSILIPGEQTENFYVDSIGYTPVRKSEQVTVVIDGQNLSPQLGVLVDGVPLPKSISIGNTGTSDASADGPTGAKVLGQYELVNSGQLVMKFSMGPDYVGTPNITLITPSKSSAINFFRMDINGREDSSLRDRSPKEPMFMDALSLDSVELVSKLDDRLIKVRLKGKGMRPGATVWVGDKKLKYRDVANPFEELATQTDTGEYILYFHNPNSDTSSVPAAAAPTSAQAPAASPSPVRRVPRRRKNRIGKRRIVRTVTVAQQAVPPQAPSPAVAAGASCEEKKSLGLKIKFWQKTTRSFETAELGKDFKANPGYEIRNYAADANRKVGVLDLRIFSECLLPVVEISPPPSSGTSRHPVVTPEGAKTYRAVLEIPYQTQGTTPVESTKVSVKVMRGTTPAIYDIDLPVRPQIAKVTASQLPGTDTGAMVEIVGLNLTLVTQVQVGDEQAQIVSADNEKMIIKIAKGVWVKQKGVAQLPVILTLKDGSKVTAVIVVGTPEPEKKSDNKETTSKKSTAKKR